MTPTGELSPVAGQLYSTSSRMVTASGNTPAADRSGGSFHSDVPPSVPISIILQHEPESKVDDDDTVSAKVGNVVASPHGIDDDEYYTVPPAL
jgi:hypothetical protein